MKEIKLRLNQVKIKQERKELHTINVRQLGKWRELGWVLRLILYNVYLHLTNFREIKLLYTEWARKGERSYISKRERTQEKVHKRSDWTVGIAWLLKCMERVWFNLTLIFLYNRTQKELKGEEVSMIMVV